VVVLYKGRVVESGPVAKVFERPEDPYTAKLMKDVPKLPGGRPDSGPDGGPDARLGAN
jgi:ABC-type dipeptide/oligopeptide/nickel transport system ATPase component